jgi:hypothetical protein
MTEFRRVSFSPSENTYVVKTKIWGYHSGVAEDSNILESYAVSTGKKSPVLRRVLVLLLHGWTVQEEVYLLELLNVQNKRQNPRHVSISN